MTTALQPDSPPLSQRPLNPRARIVNAIMYAFCVASATFAIALLCLIIGYVLYRGFSSLNLSLFTNIPQDTPAGMRNCIAGTLILIFTASLVGVPLGMLCGIYLAEFAKDNLFTRAVRVTVDVLAGTPSIIVGVLAYQLIVRPSGSPSGYAGTLALAFMMCPIIARTTEEMLKLVPHAYREASVGVGASKFQTLTRVVLPSASTGIITGIMLAVARIAGETAPLYFTTGGSGLPLVEYQHSLHPLLQMAYIALLFILPACVLALFEKARLFALYLLLAGGLVELILAFFAAFGTLHLTLPSIRFGEHYPTMTVWIYENSTSDRNDWVQAAWAGMLVLIILIVILNLAVRYVARDRHVKPR